MAVAEHMMAAASQSGDSLQLTSPTDVTASLNSGVQPGISAADGHGSAATADVQAVIQSAINEGYMAALTISRYNTDALVRGGVMWTCMCLYASD